MTNDEIINKHQNIALQFSGGKDSLVCLYLLKPHWNKLTVYYCNSGDALPETLEVIERVKSEVPHFKEVMGKVLEVHKNAICSDIVPCDATAFGRMSTNNSYPLIIDRYTCTYHSIMLPLHEQMITDKITLIIRGQRNDDNHKGIYRSGQTMKGPNFTFQALYPIEDWTEAEVFNFLKENNVELPRYYKEGLKSGPDTMSCTSWLDLGQQEYIKRHYPDKYREIHKRLMIIADAVSQSYENLQKALNY